MQKWAGRIIAVTDSFFTAELVPESDGPTVEADFDLMQLGPAERKVVPGDVVYVTVRTVNEVGGYPTKTCSVRLRRLGLWTADEVASQQSRAREKVAILESLIE